ncbi:hypothetical protein UY3_11820 [Chelonia mydas]|uniref:Uncharacterized protein n=1 Tax=Chelonia mydas TaxID=8469 RepID=M7B691_CHEMY|nr:hypothetical protein UY3_11820 [Chelonia mydas]
MQTQNFCKVNPKQNSQHTETLQRKENVSLTLTLTMVYGTWSCNSSNSDLVTPIPEFYVSELAFSYTNVKPGRLHPWTMIQDGRVKWFGHVVRMSQNCILRQALHWIPPGGRRKRGGQQMTYKKTIEKDAAVMETDSNRARNMA